VLAERFRRLAASLHHAQLVDGLRTVMVTSADPGDGKTLTSANLALTLSESYRRQVLLVDADLRRPSLHDVFRVPNVVGLNEGLKASQDMKLQVLRITDTLTLLPAGRPDPDPMSSLTSTRMGEILKEGAARFDWVIVDTAPVGLLADANLLSTMVE
jgi:capsular exopolysaccharide synthesis family protein